MNLKNIFRRKAAQENNIAEKDPDKMPEPTDIQGFMRRGWAYHSRGDQARAEADFKQALALDSHSVDANYAIGLVYKAQNKKEPAIEAFNHTIELIQSGALEEEQSRAEMLRRLALGHINELTIGDWNLEDQVWHRAT